MPALVRPDPAEAPSPGGVQIFEVVPGSPAAQAHLCGAPGGDYILKVNGTPVHEPDDLFLALGTILAGSTAQLEVFHRTGRTETISVTLAKFYVPGKIIATNRPPAIGGLRVDYVDPLEVTVQGRTRKLGEILKYDHTLAQELHPRDRVHTYGSFYIADVNLN